MHGGMHVLAFICIQRLYVIIAVVSAAAAAAAAA